MISHPHEAIFHPYHSNIDKDNSRPLCFTSTVVVPAKSKVRLKEWMSEQSKSTSAWMGSLFSRALLLCGQENKSLITLPCEVAHALRGHQDRWWWGLWGGLKTRNNDFFTSSYNSDECVTKTSCVQVWQRFLSQRGSESNEFDWNMAASAELWTPDCTRPTCEWTNHQLIGAIFIKLMFHRCSRSHLQYINVR